MDTDERSFKDTGDREAIHRTQLRINNSTQYGRHMIKATSLEEKMNKYLVPSSGQTLNSEFPYLLYYNPTVLLPILQPTIQAKTALNMCPCQVKPKQGMYHDEG